jgi:A/G-specific adenine glycosylase
VYEKGEKEWLAGQYEVPTFILSSMDKKLKQYPYLKIEIDQAPLKKIKTGISKYKITNSILITDQKKLRDLGFVGKGEWRDFEDEKSNLSTTTAKVIKLMTKS